MQLLDLSAHNQQQALNLLKTSQPNQPSSQTYKNRPFKPIKKSCIKRQSKSKKINHWNEFQQRRYVKFLQQSGHLMFLSFKEKRQLKVNQLMSRKVKSRTASQCHSHHQKMLFTHHSIEQIIEKHSYLLQNEPKYFISKKEPTQTFVLQEQTIIQQQQKMSCQLVDYMQSFFTTTLRKDPSYWMHEDHLGVLQLQTKSSSISDKDYNPSNHKQDQLSFSINKEIAISNSEQAIQLFCLFHEDNTEYAQTE